MKNLFSSKTTLAALSLALLSLAAPAVAQTSLTFHAPFAFAAGSQYFAPGEYNLTVDAGRMQLLIDSPTSMATSIVRLAQGGATRPAATADGGMVRFEKLGDRYFLVGVWRAGSVNGDAIAASRKLVESAKAEAGPEAAGSYVDLR